MCFAIVPSPILLRQANPCTRPSPPAGSHPFPSNLPPYYVELVPVPAPHGATGSPHIPSNLPPYYAKPVPVPLIHQSQGI
ncbi:hypothetical protein PCANC_28266 [Puccinia coronata f. sp. avenae]|uniref:Uncharacterized protein n=1 Tax=Puccinia coronata f. sp. avenae TaxID=200324 RepID=A0A2N5RX59_9BASI|nr:hypothetical protein PCANC_28266 [Puccinia coronata f. sp. avenae]